MIPKNTLILVDAIRATKKKLTKDDEGLVSTCSIYARQNRLISDKQAKWLQDIYAKTTGGGQYENRQRI
jgi:hypothetical protein